ncbi:hypothetical protein PPL_08265 [Heterostelium album PN500]|uniref:Uncharacterized protein n=1 Tax=Heterostelium pallidum (strain ATCC 26659 / Pp 5 / PN500) TaxID=670386 RepID=D3BHQ2_HETP5|nr:hypothetical protein PPL_08265 [Heterostelium album PN500]EFA78802.1 hypothetical protein PPL_08265 [Heterostelium album PN500]|eukprot:XP_020430926.1 hypothetical protein PPL_08265 [Heterostelium album PN500]
MSIFYKKCAIFLVTLCISSMVVSKSEVLVELPHEVANHGRDTTHNSECPIVTSNTLTSESRKPGAKRDIEASWKKEHYTTEPMEPVNFNGTYVQSPEEEGEDFDIFADGKGATVWAPLSPPAGTLYTIRGSDEKNYILGRSQNANMRIVKKCGSYWYQSKLYFKSWRQVKQDNKWNQNTIKLAVATGTRTSNSIDISRPVSFETNREDYQCPSDMKWVYGSAPDGSLWLANMIMSLIDIVSGNFGMTRRGLQILDSDVNGIARGWNTVASDCATTFPPEHTLVPSIYALEDSGNKRYMYKVRNRHGYLIAECNGDALWFSNNDKDDTYVVFTPIMVVSKSEVLDELPHELILI